MRQSLGQLLRHTTAGVLSLAAVWASCGSTAAAPAPEVDSIPFDLRHRAVQHGGIVRAANSSITCRARQKSCSDVREGKAGVNGDFDMHYIDVDSDPNTYNSSRATLRLPSGSRVTYARLYWGGNLRVGEQKPAEDTGRVLIAEPGGEYKEVLADTIVGHRVTDDADAFQASADVTSLVGDSGSGLYTVAQVNVAAGQSAAGAWGGWTLVVVYENQSEPLRQLALWDGFAALRSRGEDLRLTGLNIADGASGQVGLVAYNGDRGTAGDSLVVTGPSGSASLGDGVNPRDDVLNSTISGPGTGSRVPDYGNTLGYDSDVFDVGRGMLGAGTDAALRLTSASDAAWAGVFFLTAEARQ
ncbi:hypothetical protein GCM10009535_40040 [Streptomyces thermocarboxydovorans]|uniref:DUF3344 domain-containing protein n=1 Tax=Streptomyces thermocarboxydovorans TaxID=59298 RepID=A0ABP3SZ23_9ACTN